VHDAYALADQADTLAGEGRHDEAADLYRRACALAPGSDELRFWAGLGAAQAGDLDAAVEALSELEPNWLELLGRLPAEVAPAAPALTARLREPG
jgi:tetratricopeptide (TPR) repeat protein